MKIAVISNGALSLLNFRAPLMAKMVALGHEVLAFAPDHDAATRAQLRALGVTAVDCAMARAGTNPLRELAVIFTLHRLLRRHRPDLCFAYFLKPVIYGTIAAWLARVPRRYGLIEGLGFAFTGMPSRKQRLIQRVIGTLGRFASARMDRLLFQNRDDLAEFVSRGTVAPSKAVLIGAAGVDLAEWSEQPLQEGRVTFLLAARLLWDKGIGDYVAAARLLRQIYPEARFVLLGGLDDNPAAISRAEVEAWVAEGLIEWPGHVAVKPWLAESHVYVLPSYYREGVPRSTQEAMALGRAVITTDVPGCRETVVDGVNGFLVPPHDPEALASAMRRFLEAPELIAAMGAQSRRLATERFDATEQDGKLLAVMGLLGEPQPTGLAASALSQPPFVEGGGRLSS